MTPDSLFQECWAELPFIRKRLYGKDATKSIFIDTLQEWDPTAMAGCLTAYQAEQYHDALLAKVKARSAGNDGFVILTFLAIAVASAVISWLIQRWLDHQFPRAEFEAMRVGL